LTPDIIVRPRARDDIDAQAEYLMANVSLGAGMRFLAAVEETCALLADRPFAGARSEHLPNSGLVTRSLPVTGFDKHLILYRPFPDYIDVVRVVHGQR
jgi:plasmid stabilization system protein ParE